MCGIVGMSGLNRNGFSIQNTDLFTHLLILDYTRGEDSTGMFMTNTNNEAKMVKQAAPPNIFLRGQGAADLLKDATTNGRILCGHNRKATSGGINSQYAHPFMEGNTVMVHNGFLANHKKYFDTDVDSMALAKLLAKASDLKDYQDLFNTVEGAFAVVWYNTDTGNLQFYRNSQRPLHYIETTQGMIWASEKPMLAYAKEKAYFPTAEIKEFEPNYIYTLDFWGKLVKDDTRCGVQTYQNHGAYGAYQGGGHSSKKDVTPSTTVTSTTGSVTIEAQQANDYPILKDNGLKVGDKVLFQPYEAHQNTKAKAMNAEHAYFIINGTSWLPGLDAMDATFILKTAHDVNVEQIRKIYVDLLFEATVKSATNSKSTNPNTIDKLYLADLNLSLDLKDSDWGGRFLTETEFEWLQGAHTCEICSDIASIQPDEVKHTLFYHLGTHTYTDEQGEQQFCGETGQYIYVCRSCLAKYNSGEGLSHDDIKTVDRILDGKFAVSA